MTLELFKKDQDGDITLFALELPCGGFTVYYDLFFKTVFLSVFNREKSIFWL
jgi:hypothetical protein